MFPPDNFLYFIILFTINISAAVYLLFSYSRTWFLLINAVVFVLIAARCCTEYYIQGLDHYADVFPIVRVHSFIFVASALVWSSAWYYIRPFRNKSYEKTVNRIYVSMILLYLLLVTKPTLGRIMFQMSPEKIEGYWKYTTLTSSAWTQFFFAGSFFFALVTAALFVIDMYRDRGGNWHKTLLVFVFIFFPAITYFRLLTANSEIGYTIPNVAFAYTINILIANWFFTGYRMFTSDAGAVVQDTFDSITDLIFLTDSRFRIVRANEAAVDDLSLLDKDKELVDVFAGKSSMLAEEVESLLNALAKGETEEVEMKMILRGQERIYLVKAAQFLKNGQVGGYTFILNDVTEKKAVGEKLAAQNEQLTELNYVKDRIFAVLGHDLRKPAIAFRGIAKKVNYLIKKKDFVRLEELGQNIEQNANALNSLTDNLLNWALAQKDVVPYNPSPINVNEAIEEVLKMLHQPRAEKQIKINNQIDPFATVYADLNGLSTMIRNIVDNAIKYTPEGGLIRFSMEVSAENVSILISDTGVGMNQMQLDDLFQLKRNKSEQGTSGEKGTGLGLHLVKELAKVNKGEVLVESSEGIGTTFNIILPLAA